MTLWMLVLTITDFNHTHTHVHAQFDSRAECLTAGEMTSVSVAPGVESIGYTCRPVTVKAGKARTP